ncbi:MAG TPA: hypothetical protein VFZ59_18510 [Verrucomicrobiae bacterium]|nr:hypothetical protein [Verrucomicrobiae bacterium]
MQTSKYLLAAGVLAAVILPLQVQGGPDTEEQAKLREALRRALEQPNAAQAQPVTAAKPEAAPKPAEPTPVTPPPEPAQPAPVAPPPATPTPAAQTPAETFEPVPNPDNAESLARAREALRQKLQEMQATPQPAPVAAVAPAPAPKPGAAPAPAAKPAATPVATSTYKPIEVPASPFSPAKQAKLAELLARYRADAITSQEYHTQRAAIIAEP